MPAQLLDVVADAANAELAEVRQVLADLRSVEVELLGERVRRNGAHAGGVELSEAPEVDGQPIGRQLGDRLDAVAAPTVFQRWQRVGGLLVLGRVRPGAGELVPFLHKETILGQKTPQGHTERLAANIPGRMAHQPVASVATRPAAPAAFQPYVPANKTLAEFTAKAIVLGALFGLLFGASTVYLGLRAGLTVSASIPIAVLAISVLKKLGGSTILENNIVQTIGSAGESVAGGVVFTVPALIFLTPRGPEYFNYFQITMLAFAGGILGVLMMVPLRRALIVKEHGVLPYPEGTACADVLVAGERGGALAQTVFMGLGVGALWKGLSWIVQLFPTDDRLHRAADRNLSECLDERGHLSRVHGSRLRHRPQNRRRHVCRRRAVVARPSAAALDHGQLHDRALPASPPQRFADRSDVGRSALERLHSLYGRRRRTRSRADHARAHDSHDRLVVPRQHERSRRKGRGGDAGADGARHSAARRPRRQPAAGDLPRRGARDAHPGQFPGGGAHDRLRLLLRHGVVAHRRPDWHVVEPHLGDDDRDADPHLHDLRDARLDG